MRRGLLAIAALGIAIAASANASSVAQDFDVLGPEDTTIVRGDAASAEEPVATVSTTDTLLEARDSEILSPLDLEALAAPDEPEAAPEPAPEESETAADAPVQPEPEVAPKPRPLAFPRPLPRVEPLRRFEGYIGDIGANDRDTARDRSTSR